MFNFLFKKKSLSAKVKLIESQLKILIKDEFEGHFWVYRYGEYKIDPKNLVFWVCVKTNQDKEKLSSNLILRKKMKQLLIDFQYPEDAISFVHMGFESQENVDKESQGNWYYHFK